MEVIKLGQDVIDKESAEDFIRVFRVTIEDTHGNEIGYSLEEFLYFIDKIMEVSDIQYLATASWGKNIYKQTIRQGNHKGLFMNKVVYDHIDGRVPIISSGEINSPEKALEALQYSDIVGASTPFVTEPDFVIKLKEGREEDIDLGFTPEEVPDLAIPERAFKDIVELMDI